MKIADVGEDAFATSIIVAAELRNGAAKVGSARLAAQLEAILAALEVVAFEAPADTTYGNVRAALEEAGTPIGGNDRMIASQALAWDMIMVTTNASEFRRVDGLRVENWLED
jgi:tRNA(fMet)-specific endonuclease VapC